MSTDTWTVRRVLDWTRGYFEEKGLDSPRLDAELLVADALGYDRMKLYLNPGQPLTAEELAGIRERVQRRARHEPVAYITGTRGFWTLDLDVDARVLVPRPETEGLVELALKRLNGELLPVEPRSGELRVELIDFREPAEATPPPAPVDPEAEPVVELFDFSEPLPEEAVEVAPEPVPEAPAGPAPVVVDVGTGSGCIALAIAQALPRAEVYAIDRSVEALAVASANAEKLGLKLFFAEGNVLQPRPPKPVDLVVSNPPYIASAEVDRLMPDVREYEPRGALDGGADGLDVIRPLVAQAAEVLKPGGHLLLEIGYDQGPAVKALVQADGRYRQVAVHPDLAGRDRYVEAVRA